MTMDRAPGIWWKSDRLTEGTDTVVSIPPLEGVEHRYVVVGGQRVHVAEAGDGEPLVLLHTSFQHWWTWRRLIPRLAERHGLSAPTCAAAVGRTLPAEGYDEESLEPGTRRAAGRSWPRPRGAPPATGWVDDRFPGGPARTRALQRIPRDRCRPSLAVRGSEIPLPACGGAGISRSWQPRASGRASPVPALPQRGCFAERAPILKRGVTRMSRPTRGSSTRRRERGRSPCSTGPFWPASSRQSCAAATATCGLTVPTLLLFGSRDAFLSPHGLRGFEDHADAMNVEILEGEGHFRPRGASGAGRRARRAVLRGWRMTERPLIWPMRAILWIGGGLC